MEDRPWGEWKRGKPLSGVSLARLLKPFGIKPIQLKEDGQNKRGYELKQFEDDLARYTYQPHTPNRNATPLPSFNHGGFEGNRNATPKKAVADENRSKLASIAKGSGVALQKGDLGGEDIKVADSITKPEQEVIEIW